MATKMPFVASQTGSASMSGCAPASPPLKAADIDHLSWSADVTLSVQGGTLREARLTLPPTLVLATVESAGLAGWRQVGNAVMLTWAAPVG